MIDLLFATGAVERLGMTVWYVVITLIGLIGLGFSLLFGGHETDHDHDTDHGDHGGHHDGDGHHGNMSLLNLKVIWTFMVGFGVGGFFGARAQLGQVGSVMTGVFAGLVMAALGYLFLNAFYRRQSSSNVHSQRLVGMTGVVETTIAAGGTGRISVNVDGRSVLMLADCEDGIALPEGARVRILDTNGGAVSVQRIIPTNEIPVG